MTHRRMEDDPYWTRVEKVLSVLEGRLSAAEAAEALALSPKHFYRLEEKVLAAALAAATPAKPGPKPQETDPRLQELADQVARMRRERELLELKLAELEQRNRNLKAQKDALEGGKKKRRSARQSAGQSLRSRLQAAGGASGGTGASGGSHGGGDVPDARRGPCDPLPLADEGTAAGPPRGSGASGAGAGGGDEGGSARPASS